MFYYVEINNILKNNAYQLIVKENEGFSNNLFNIEIKIRKYLANNNIYLHPTDTSRIVKIVEVDKSYFDESKLFNENPNVCFYNEVL